MSTTITTRNELWGIQAADVPTLVAELYAVNFSIVASSVLIFWDTLLTLDREVQYIWRNRTSLVTVLFGVLRFLAVGGQLSFLAFNMGTLDVTESFCRGVIWFQGMLGLVMFVCVDVLLIYRLFAFYGRNKTLLVSLCTLEVVTFGAVLGLISIGFPKFRTTPNPIPHKLRTGICIPLGYPNIEPDLWLPLLATQTVLFGLAIGRHSYLHWKGSFSRNTSAASNIYRVFVRDGVWAFFALFVDLLLCVIGNGLQKVLGPIAIQWCYTVIGISASRLILNLRSANEQSQILLRPPVFENSVHKKLSFPDSEEVSYGSKSNEVVL